MTPAKRDQFLRLNPRHQVITKTDLAKVENCFDLMPDVACKGAQKSFIGFAERVTKEWTDERKRSLYGDDWYRAAVARVILFRAIEGLVSNAHWYEGGYRAQIVAYTAARLATSATTYSGGGRLDYLKIWTAQTVGDVLERQLLSIAEVMTQVLRSPPQAGQNITEWAKQQACSKIALETEVPADPGFDRFLIGKADTRADAREERSNQRVTDALAAVSEILELGAETWRAVRIFARTNKLASPDDDRALDIACGIPRVIPSDRQAERLQIVMQRCQAAGFEGVGDDL